MLEERVALLEGGVGAVATASGTAAILYAVLNLAKAGDEIVASKYLYGGTTHLFEGILNDCGITVRLVDIRDHAAVEAAINARTRAVFTETIGNPTNVVADLAQLAAIAHAHGVPLIVDNTVTTPYLLRPFELGADIVVHSLTKYLGGHGTSIGGVVVDGGRFDYSSWPRFGQPDASQHGLVYTAKFGSAAYIARLRGVVLRDTGACLAPFNAFTLLLGIETLSLRMQRHCANALTVAEFLEARRDVAWVNYPGLSSHPDHALASRMLPLGSGAIIAFAPQGGYARAKQVVDRVKLFSHLANIGDAKSLIIHPASTTHQQLNAEQQLAAGLSPDLIRLSIGIEDATDLLADLSEALDA
ncbi:MAG: Methionine gamma-lyase [Deltaproteobacteria bacterium ADurb.Bin510]|nr:MAG: Methionine gamma-lyase [Deltaproteobacteria bacterium ADurb.Bin510]